MTFEWEISAGNIFVVLGVALSLFVFHRRATQRLERLDDLSRRINIILLCAAKEYEEFKTVIEELRAEMAARAK